MLLNGGTTLQTFISQPAPSIRFTHPSGVLVSWTTQPVRRLRRSHRLPSCTPSGVRMETVFTPSGEEVAMTYREAIAVQALRIRDYVLGRSRYQAMRAHS